METHRLKSVLLEANAKSTIGDLPVHRSKIGNLRWAVAEQPNHVRIGIFGHRADSFRGLWNFSLTGRQKEIGFEAVLLVVKFAVSPGKRIQRSMRAALDDFSALDHQNLIGAANGGKAMSDHKCSPPAHQLREAFLNQHFRFRLE